MTDESKNTPVMNITEGAVSGLDHEPLTPRRGTSTLAGHPDYRPESPTPNSGSEGVGDPAPSGSDDDGEVLRGEALDKALEDAGLSKSGTADEKRERLRQHQEG